MKKCSVKDCACRGTKDASESHDTGFRIGPAGCSIPIFVSTSIPDPPGWLMVSGDWKLPGTVAAESDVDK